MSPTQHVPELRQLVEPRPPQEPADRRDRGRRSARPHGAGRRFGVLPHRPELVDREDAAVLADALLVIEHRPGRRELDQPARPRSMSGAAQQQTDRRGDDDRAAACAARAAPRLAEARREDQPARPQVLDGDLAGVLLVDRRQVVERHARRASSRAACPSAACRARRPG